VKGALWLLALFLVAVAVTLAARYNSGYVLIVAQPYRVELSLNLLAVLLLLVIFIGYFVVRLTVFTLRLPTEVSEFRSRRRREKALKAMLDGFKAFFEGHYTKAEKAAAAALQLEESPSISAISAMVAARSAHGLRNYSRRDEFIALAESSAPQEVTLRLMTQAELLLDENRSDEALKILHSLPAVESHQHTAALRLELKAQQRAENWNAVLELLGKLEQRDAVDITVMRKLRRRAHVENVKGRMLNPQALKEYWQNISPDDKKDSKLAAAAAHAYIRTGDCATANQIIEQSLNNQWDSELAELYAECVGNDAIRQMERAEAWLKTHPNDGSLLLALGKLCVYSELWGKAQNYLEASLSVEPDYPAHLALAQLNEKLGRSELAKDHYSKGLEFALRRLEARGAGTSK
jgi:HemY protein